MKMIMIGLTGGRHVGKSTVARHLVERHGFSRLHPFDGGKAASRAFFMHLGADEETAWRMTDGDLKDKPSPILPVIRNPEHVIPGKCELGDHYMPRFFMEKLGHCMGTVLGPEWTLEMELKRIADAAETDEVRVVAESIVFEAAEFQAMGGVILEVVRDIEGGDRPIGIETDPVVAAMKADFLLENSKTSLMHLHEMLDGFLAEHFGIGEREPALAP